MSEDVGLFCNVIVLSCSLNVLLDNLIKVDYLGHVITHKGLAADCSKVESMKTWPGPQTIQALSGFLGLTGYDRKFAKDWENKAGLN